MTDLRSKPVLKCTSFERCISSSPVPIFYQFIDPADNHPVTPLRPARGLYMDKYGLRAVEGEGRGGGGESEFILGRESAEYPADPARVENL